MNPRSRSAAAASSSAPAPRLRERLKLATRDAILDAAEAVFARDGVPGARMEDVAGAAGVAVGTLYNYFADRHALLEALLDARRNELLARLDAALAGRSQPFERRLRAFLTTMFEYFQQHLGIFALHMEAELVLRSRKQRSRPALSAVLERSTRLMKEGVQSGALRSADADLYADRRDGHAARRVHAPHLRHRPGTEPGRRGAARAHLPARSRQQGAALMDALATPSDAATARR